MRNFMVILFYYISVGGNNVFQKEIYNTWTENIRDRPTKCNEDNLKKRVSKKYFVMMWS